VLTPADPVSRGRRDQENDRRQAARLP